MRLTSSGAYSRPTAVPKMPLGLVDLMEGLTKDVLKNNPSNIYKFCANHLEQLINIRDGPSSKKCLTLEQKISIAQEKVRERALERQKRFDNEIGAAIINNVENVSQGIKNSLEADVIPNRSAPVHHDQDLFLASEVEISHEPLTDNSIASKDCNIDEIDDIPISKSSTYSSVSKSTVIDLGNDSDNKEQTNDETGAPKNKDAKNTETTDPVHDFEIEITEDDNIQSSLENVYKDDELKNIDPPATDNKYQQEVEEISDLIISVEDSVFDSKLENYNHNTSSEELNTVIKEHAHVVELKSLDGVNVIIEEEDENIANIETCKSESLTTEQRIGLTIPVGENDADESLLENIQCNLANKNSNLLAPEKRVSDENVLNTKMNNIKNDKDITEQLVVPAYSELDNTIDETKSKIQDCTDYDSNKTPNLSLMNDSGIPLCSPDSVLLGEIKDEIKSTLNSTESINALNETEHIINEVKPTVDPNETNHQPINLVTEIEVLDIQTTPNLKNEVIETNQTSAKENDHNSVNNSHTVIEEKNSLDNTSKKENGTLNSLENTTLTRAGTIETNDDSSVIGSDVSKAEDDLSRSDNQNDQTNMDLETAAVTIQKVFRSFLFKSRNSTFEDITNDDTTYLEEDNDKKEEYYAANINKERRPLGITRMDTVLQTVNEEKSLSLSTDDSSTLSSAATTIQAHVRGFLVRNKLNSYKTVSTNSLVNSNEMLDDTEHKSKTILNIHIVPEQGNYLSRDESLMTSMELSLDGSPPSSINLHPLSYDISERRKLLKREDAIQSVSPPSNNSGKLSEDSVKEVLLTENDISKTESNMEIEDQHMPGNNSIEPMTAVTAVSIRDSPSEQDDSETITEKRKKAMIKLSSDESDVITPFIGSPQSLVGDNENTPKLVHSGEFHDVVLPTKVSRSDTTVVREFKNVLAYFLLWNHS